MVKINNGHAISTYQPSRRHPRRHSQQHSPERRPRYCCNSTTPESTNHSELATGHPRWFGTVTDSQFNATDIIKHSQSKLYQTPSRKTEKTEQERKQLPWWWRNFARWGRPNSGGNPWRPCISVRIVRRWCNSGCPPAVRISQHRTRGRSRRLTQQRQQYGIGNRRRIGN